MRQWPYVSLYTVPFCHQHADGVVDYGQVTTTNNSFFCATLPNLVLWQCDGVLILKHDNHKNQLDCAILKPGSGKAVPLSPFELHMDENLSVTCLFCIEGALVFPLGLMANIFSNNVFIFIIFRDVNKWAKIQLF